jgi:hypothetical protein
VAAGCGPRATESHDVGDLGEAQAQSPRARLPGVLPCYRLVRSRWFDAWTASLPYARRRQSPVAAITGSASSASP